MLIELKRRTKGCLGKVFPSCADCCKLTTFPFFTGPTWMLPHHLPIKVHKNTGHRNDLKQTAHQPVFLFAAVTISSAAIPAKNPVEALGKRSLPNSCVLFGKSDTVIETDAAHPKYTNSRHIISKCINIHINKHVNIQTSKYLNIYNIYKYKKI